MPSRPGYAVRMEDHMDEAAKWRERALAAEAMLRKVEWVVTSEPPTDVGVCPWCGWTRTENHQPRCGLRSLLDRADAG